MTQSASPHRWKLLMQVLQSRTRTRLVALQWCLILSARHQQKIFVKYWSIIIKLTQPRGMRTRITITKMKITKLPQLTRGLRMMTTRKKVVSFGCRWKSVSWHEKNNLYGIGWNTPILPYSKYVQRWNKSATLGCGTAATEINSNELCLCVDTDRKSLFHACLELKQRKIKTIWMAFLFIWTA